MTFSRHLLFFNSLYMMKEYYRIIDLDLPSGTLWTDRNIGAKTIDDMGFRFQWGSIKPRETIGQGWNDYPYSDNSVMTKYNALDNLDKLLFSDDPAYNLMGELWKTPCIDNYLELTSLRHCWKCNGIEFTGNNGNKLFFPVGPINFNYCSYWSCNRGASNIQVAYYFCWGKEEDRGIDAATFRCFSLPIRAIINP